MHKSLFVRFPTSALVQSHSFGIGKIWRTPFERGSENMIPHAGGHAEVTAMRQMVVARMAQPRPIKIGTTAQPPMVGRIVDKYVPKVTGDKARRCGCAQVKSKNRPGWDCNRHQAN